MKRKFTVSLVLVLMGTNLFTYATARYLTTCQILTAARTRVHEVLDSVRAGENRPGQPPEARLDMAVGQAGGLYYWWNDGLPYWGLGGLLVASGISVLFLRSPKKDALEHSHEIGQGRSAEPNDAHEPPLH